MCQLECINRSTVLQYPNNICTLFTFEAYWLRDAPIALTIQQLYALPTLYLCVLYLSQNKQRLVPLTAQTDWFL